MLKYVVSTVAPKKITINHQDLLNLPKISFRNRLKKNGENKNKRKGTKKRGSQVIKGISPQFPLKTPNVEIMSEIIEEE